MKRSTIVLLAASTLVLGASVVVHALNDFARVQDAGIGNTPIARDTLSRIVITNNASKKIAFHLRCDHKVQARGEQFSAFHVLQPRASVEVDVNPELAGRELPRMIADKSCEATWRGPLGISCRAWRVDWTYGKPAHKGVMMSEEDGACRIATCYSSTRLSKMPSCLYAVYLAPRERPRKS